MGSGRSTGIKLQRGGEQLGVLLSPKPSGLCGQRGRDKSQTSVKRQEGEGKAWEGTGQQVAVRAREGRSSGGGQLLPGCGFGSGAVSDRTWAGGPAVWATLDKWSEGLGSGPAFPLQEKALLSLP